MQITSYIFTNRLVNTDYIIYLYKSASKYRLYHVITQRLRLVNRDCIICHCTTASQCRLQHMSLQIGIASYVITKRHCIICHYKAASKCRLYHTSSNINKAKFIYKHKNTTTKYAALFQGRGVVCPLSADVALIYTTNSNINGLQRFVFLLSFPFKLFPFRTSM